MLNLQQKFTLFWIFPRTLIFNVEKVAVIPERISCPKTRIIIIILII